MRAQDKISIDDDPYIWLEDVEGKDALEWVRKHDSATLAELAQDSLFKELQKEATNILNTKDRIPYGSLMGGFVYNFWQDDEHVRGILRRTTVEEYKKKDPTWEILLDIDKLNRDEGKSWVYKGSSALPPEYSRSLIFLSEGGKDAVVTREFDFNTKTFVKDGFSIPEAKTSAYWYNSDALIVATDYGPGSLTISGYPRIVKLWKRGTPLSDATILLEGENSDVEVGGYVKFRPEGNVFTLNRTISFWKYENWIVGENLEKIKIPIPNDAEVKTFFKGFVITLLHSDWLGFAEGSLIAIKISDIGFKDLKPAIDLLYAPDEISALEEVRETRDYLIVSILKNVRSSLQYFTLDSSEGKHRWNIGEINLPNLGTADVAAYNSFNNAIMVSFQDFLTPPTLFYLEDPKSEPEAIKSLAPMFDAGGLRAVQFQAKSYDGTQIPYTVISRIDLRLDGRNPTLLYGYGGFRSAQVPYYSGTIGKLWLERGGVYVLANIRGGGEFGPKWHRAALLENRQKSFDDFEAIAEDIISRGITSPKNLGIMGGSNGGLLVGAAFTQKPDLFGAVVCQVPLLDMLRYSKLPPGASWIGEYGDPDSADARAFISNYSPYQNLKKGVKYPQVLFITSTKDDRVHPGHARKMAAKMEEYGNKVYFYEEMEGGHGASADNVQRAKRMALEYAYLFKMLSN
jgi:prolyl oligopeptidase